MATGMLEARQWEVGFAKRRIYVKKRVESPDGEIKIRSVPLDLLYVIVQRSEHEVIPFFVSRRNGRVSLTDYREQMTGTAGSGGFWDTLPLPKPGRRKSLTPTGWKAEISRLIGSQKAEDILRDLGC